MLQATEAWKLHTFFSEFLFSVVDGYVNYFLHSCDVLWLPHEIAEYSLSWGLSNKKDFLVFLAGCQSLHLKSSLKGS